jgi:hypothetical protein
MKPFTTLSIVVFVLIAGGHLARILFGWEVTIAGRGVPTWPSAVAFVAMGLLAVLLAREGTKSAIQAPSARPRPPQGTPAPDPAQYGNAISLIEHQIQIFWLVFGAFLLAETVLLGAIISILKDGPKVVIFVGSVAGLLLVFPWWTSFRYNHTMYRLRMMQARAFEPECGSFFDEGRLLIEEHQEVRGVKMPWSARVLPQRWADAVLVVLFAIAFFFLAVWYRPWQD